MLDAGIPIESVSKMMGHTNISNTQVYAKISMDMITINEGGVVTIPSGEIRITNNEIALLFEVMLSTIRGKIKALMRGRDNVDCDRESLVAPRYSSPSLWLPFRYNT